MPWYLGNSNAVLSMWWMRYPQWGLAIVLTWAAVWKGIALWHAAKRNEKLWFVGLFIVNTVGILEICYLLFVVKFFSSHEIVTKTIRKKKKK